LFASDRKCAKVTAMNDEAPTEEKDKPVYISGQIHRAAKSRAADQAENLKDLVERALRKELGIPVEQEAAA